MIITNAKIVTPQKIFQGDIVIDNNGKIKSLLVKLAQTRFEIRRQTGKDKVFDAHGKYILPGLIEVHGHMREPGMEGKEDVPHGTRAALAGGFTTIIDMPNTKPPTTTVARLQEKINTVYLGKSHTDYAFFMGVDKNHLAELAKVDRNDIVGVKVFMAGHETTPTTIPDDATLEKIMQICAKRGLLLAIHAEDQILINQFDKQLKQTGRTDPALWSELRPKEVVIKAVERVLRIAQHYKPARHPGKRETSASRISNGFWTSQNDNHVRLYFLHLSTREEFDLVAQAKKAGLNMYGELVSYQLLFNTNDYQQLGNKIKVAPALRSPQDQQYLWELFRNSRVIPSEVEESHSSESVGRDPSTRPSDLVGMTRGKIDVLCSEHTPHELELKNQPNVFKAQAGMPNVQETLPAIITAWTKRFGRETLEECLMTIAQLTSYNPAKIFGFDTKGEIAVGKDADLVVIDTDNEWSVKKEDLFSKCGWSAYEGMKLIGRPAATFLRGNLVYNEGKIIGNAAGKYLH